MDTTNTKLGLVEQAPLQLEALREKFRLRGHLTKDALVRGQMLAMRARPILQDETKLYREKENIEHIVVADNIIEALEARRNATAAALNAIYKDIETSTPSESA